MDISKLYNNLTGELLKPPNSNTHLHVMELSSNNAESVVAGMVIDADLRDARRRSTWHPFLLGVIVHHHRRLCTHHRMFTAHSKTTRVNSQHRRKQEAQLLL